MNKIIKTGLAGAVTLSIFLGAALSASAQTSTSTLATQVQSLLIQIQALQSQLDTLNKQKGAVKSELKQTINLTRQLARGMSGEEVALLQEVLAADSSVYPEGLVTGFFGQLTEKAVRKFQQKHGLDQIGEVGPKTRNALLAYVTGLSTSTAALPPGLAKKFGSIASTTDISGAISGFKATVCHKGTTLSVGVPALPAHLAHGDKVGPCGAPIATTTPPATTTPDTVAPVISNLSASTTASTSAVVSWSTNENADGIVWYSTTTPLATSTATKLENSTLQMSHSMSLAGLSATTTYYYKVSSKDAVGNTTMSNEASFTTPE